LDPFGPDFEGSLDSFSERLFNDDVRRLLLRRRALAASPSPKPAPKPPPPPPKPGQLLASDAKRLKDQYGRNYGDRESTKQGYIIIDVAGLPYGTTPVRFIYATSPFFLVLDPGELYFLSGGMLSPDLVREVVHFATFSCDANQQILPTRDDDRNTSKGLVLPNATTPLPNATLALMAAALTKALHSNPADDSLLRGELVLVDPRPLSGDPNGRANLLWDSPTMLQFAPENPLANAELYENPGLCKLLQLALYLCTAFGLLVSFVATYAAYFMLRKMRMDAWKKDEAETIIVMKQMGYDSATILADRASAGEDRAQPTNNPFVGPFVMLTKFIIDPIRKKQVDSIERFIRRRCTVTPAGASGRFIYMRDWARAYELFCLENKLRIETDRNLIQRELIGKYNCRVQQIRVDRLYGLRWRSGGEYGPMEAMNHANVEKDTPLVDVIRGFISEMCIADGLPGDFIDFETRNGPDGSSQLGFRPALTKWCKEKGIETPAVSIGSKDLVSALPKDVKPRDQIPVRQIRGLEWLTITGDGGTSLSWSFYMMEALTVFVHMGLCLPSLLLIYYAMMVQQKWALNLAPPSSYVPPLWNEPPAGQPPLLLFDARSDGLHEVAGQIMPDCIIAFFVNFATTAKNRLMPYFDKDYVLEEYVPDDEMPGTAFTVVGTVKLVVGECAFFMAFTLVRQVLHYADAPPSSVINGLKNAYAGLLCFQLFIYIAAAGIVACWFILATVLNPGTYLPYGAAFITLIAVGTSTYGKLHASANAVKGAIRRVFEKMLNERIVKAQKKLKQKKMERDLGMMEGALTMDHANWASSIDDAESGGSGGAKGAAGGGKAPTASDLFAMVNMDGGETVDAAEFRGLFQILELDLTESEIEQLFALCDTDLSGELSEKEFVDGWELMLDNLLDEAAASIGLSTMNIVLAVLCLLLVLSLLVSFILIALAAWSSDSPFGAAVQAGLVGGTGSATDNGRKKSPAEDMAKVEEIATELIAMKEAAAQEG